MSTETDSTPDTFVNRITVITTDGRTGEGAVVVTVDDFEQDRTLVTVMAPADLNPAAPDSHAGPYSTVGWSLCPSGTAALIGALFEAVVAVVDENQPETPTRVHALTTGLPGGEYGSTDLIVDVVERAPGALAVALGSPETGLAWVVLDADEAMRLAKDLLEAHLGSLAWAI